MAIDIKELSDWQLIVQTREGDEDAFAEIVRRFSPRVFKIASRFFRDRGIVEEVAQEAFLRAYTQLASFENRGSFEGWLTRIITSICLNTLRSAKRHPESVVADLSDNESEWLDNNADNSAMHPQSAEQNLIAADLAERLLSTLSPDDRLVLTLMEGDELSVKEIVAITGWSESKVKVQAFRARQRMRDALEKLLSTRPANLPDRS